MLRKILAGFICVMMLISFMPFTVSAAESADFKICIAEQDGKSVTITLDFAGGTGFSAFDASVDYNNLKLTLEDCQFASGFASFKEYIEGEGGMTIFNANSKEDPIKVSIATTVPFKIINNDGAILKMKFSKIEGVNVSDDDISLSIENCQNADFTDIKANVSYDFSNGSSSLSSDETVEGGKLPEESAGQSSAESSTSAQNSEVVIKTDPSKKAQNSKADSKAEDNKSEDAKTAENEQPQTKKTVAFIILGILFLAGIIVLGAIIVKNKKVSSNYD